jgi:hypothetical protein
MDGIPGDSFIVPEPFTDPSAARFNPCIAGESSDVGLAAVSPVRGAFAASIRNVSKPRDRFGDCGIACAVGVFWVDEALDRGGDVISVSPAVDVERSLDAEAENMLDGADMRESCESCSSRWYSEGIGAVIAASRSSVAIRGEIERRDSRIVT